MLREATHLLTVHEAAERLGQHEETVRRKIREGTIPALRLGHGPRAPIRVDEDELDAWLRGGSDAHDGGNDG